MPGDRGGSDDGARVAGGATNGPGGGHLEPSRRSRRAGGRPRPPGPGAGGRGWRNEPGRPEPDRGGAEPAGRAGAGPAGRGGGGWGHGLRSNAGDRAGPV